MSKNKKIKLKFKKNGVVVVRGLMPKKLIKNCLLNIKNYKNYKYATRDGNIVFDKFKGKKFIKYIQHLQVYVPYFFNLFNSRITEIAQDLLGEKVFFDCMGLHDKAPGLGTHTPFHQDNFYFCRKPAQAVTAYVALEKQNKKNGQLMYVKGSHLRGVQKHKLSLTKGFSSGLEKQNYKKEKIYIPSLNPGDVAFHHANTIHGANENLSKNLNRRAVAITIIGESAKIDKIKKNKYLQLRKANRNN